MAATDPRLPKWIETNVEPGKTSFTERSRAWLFRIWESPRTLLFSISLAVIVYSFAVLGCVATMGDIGVRCVFGRVLKADIDPGTYQWEPDHPRVGDTLLRVGLKPIALYTDYLESLRQLRGKIGQLIEVSWETPTGEAQSGASSGHPPALDDVFLVVSLVFPGTFDLHHRRPGLLETAR